MKIQEQIVLPHVPVLLHEAVEYLRLTNGGIYIDATFGAGGHTKAILEANKTVSVIAIDWDKKSLAAHGDSLQEQFGERLRTVWGNFAHIHFILKKMEVPHVSGILADFGTSSMQIREGAGFSVYEDTPLDMRMSPAHQAKTAADILATSSARDLMHLLRSGGEEKYAHKIAQRVVESRRKKPIRTTEELAQLVLDVVKYSKKRIHPATQTFQALRIAVNKELENIKSFLIHAVPLLEPEGRLVCISFHSLEDRLVKDFFREQEKVGQARVITKKVITPSDEEIEDNRASRSAKMRVLERV
jgi:16S rRNA (cytosine1402-N4)-methyltransferase